MDGKYKITADGSMLGVKVFAPDGEEITKKVCGFSVSQKPGEVAHLTLEFLASAFEADISAYKDGEINPELEETDAQIV